jgi:hypothetical protein
VGVDFRWAIGADLPEVGIADPRCMSTQLTWPEKADISIHSGGSPHTFFKRYIDYHSI